jgi:hypothetical protein
MDGMMSFKITEGERFRIGILMRADIVSIPNSIYTQLLLTSCIEANHKSTMFGKRELVIVDRFLF